MNRWWALCLCVPGMALGVTLSGGCSANGSSSVDATPPPLSTAPLDVEVVVGPGGLVVYPREVERPCTCTGAEWPKLGECIQTSDGISCTCQPAPGTCLSYLRVERDGIVIAAADLSDDSFGSPWGYGAILLEVPELFSDKQAELVLEGCGGAARVALPEATITPHTITSISHDGETVHVTWTTESQAELTLGTMGGGFGGPHCLTDTRGFTDIPFGTNNGYKTNLGVTATKLTSAHTTELGQVRVWNTARTGAGSMLLPDQRDDGRWQLWRDELVSFSFSITVDGEPAPYEFRLSDASFELNGTDPLVAFSITTFIPVGTDPESGRVNLAYSATATTDTVSVYNGRLHRTTIPHVLPDEPFTLGTPGGSRLKRTIGPIVIPSVGVPGTSVTVSASVDIDFGVVALPTRD